MFSPLSPSRLRTLFGKAFLIGLRRGDMATALLFARAFLHVSDVMVEPVVEEEYLIPLLAN